MKHKMKFPRLFFALLCATAAFVAQANTYALCVGINQYPATTDSDGASHDNSLRGCVNDATTMKAILVSKYGVPDGNVHMLTDQSADFDHLKQEWGWLMEEAKEGDQVIFCYSGHGARAEDRGEPDGYSSFIVTADLKFVPGKEFKSISRQLQSAGISSTFIFDSCFSGGMSRLPDHGKVAARIKSLGDVSSKVNQMKADFRARDVVGSREKALKRGEYAFVFGSKSDQPTMDLSYKDDSKPAHGLFTALLSAALDEQPTAAIKDLVDLVNSVRNDINKSLTADDPKAQPFEQVPSFECSSGARARQPIVLGD